MFPDHASTAVKDLIDKLLSKEPRMRLGSDPMDGDEIMKHPFFADIQWEKLLKKELVPPFVPSDQAISNLEYFSQEFTKMSLTSSYNNQSLGS